MQTQLRPIERRVISLLDSGVDVSEVARRFHRSAPHITQLARLARLDGRQHVVVPSTLRPIERRILSWRSSGASHGAIAVRFKRSAAWTARIEELANYSSRDDAAPGAAPLWPLPPDLPRRHRRRWGSASQVVAVRILSTRILWRAAAPWPARQPRRERRRVAISDGFAGRGSLTRSVGSDCGYRFSSRSLRPPSVARCATSVPPSASGARVRGLCSTAFRIASTVRSYCSTSLTGSRALKRDEASGDCGIRPFPTSRRFSDPAGPVDRRLRHPITGNMIPVMTISQPHWSPATRRRS